MTPPSPWKDDDQLVWNLSNDGIFNLRSAYNSLDRNPSMPVQVFKKVWKWNGPKRIQYLLWLVTNEAILTNATRARRHMTNIANYPRCNAEEETTIHVLQDYQFARNV
ncbi:Putative ribonuclease H protein [Arachis hypogaea]|nr:Putative ribonuclease H protein [Arachis hypogaea]